MTAAVLAHAGSGALIAPYGGGGVGLFYHLSRYDQGATSESPPYSSSNSRVSVGATLVGGSDLRLSRRVKAFAEFRFDVQSLRDPGSSSYRVLGGLRLKVRTSADSLRARGE